MCGPEMSREEFRTRSGAPQWAPKAGYQHVHQVWGRLGKLTRREGADQLVSEMFYKAVVQAVVLFGAKTWVLSAAMVKTMEGVRAGFLR